MITVLLLVLFVPSVILNYVLGRRLLQFDGFTTAIVDDIVEYGSFLLKKISGGALENSPEVKEFHFKTVEIIQRIDTWAKVWSDGGPTRSKKTTAALMSEDP